MAVRSYVELTADIASNFPDNTDGLIGASSLRSVSLNVVDTLFRIQYKDSGSTGNLLVGPLAGNSVSGTSVTAVGAEALRNLTSPSGHTAVGYRAMYSFVNGGTDCTALGAFALASLVQGTGNTAVGFGSQRHNVSGGNCTSMGDNALFSLTTGIGNTCIGYRAMFSTTTGEYNVAIGQGALIGNISGSQNIAIGAGAMSEALSVSPSSNVGVGQQSLRVVAGNANVGIGALSLFNATSHENSALGAYAGFSVTNGVGNVFVGESAGNSAQQKSDVVNSIAIGRRTFTTKDNQVVIGNASITETRVQGVVKFGDESSDKPVLKPISNKVQVRSSDDNDFSYVQGRIQSHASAVSGAPQATHTILIYDASGTPFQVLCVSQV